MSVCVCVCARLKSTSLLAVVSLLRLNWIQGQGIVWNGMHPAVHFLNLLLRGWMPSCLSQGQTPNQMNAITFPRSLKSNYQSSEWKGDLELRDP